MKVCSHAQVLIRWRPRVFSLSTNGTGTTTINGINDRGQLVGFCVDGHENTDGFVATAVPEPGSLTLNLIGTLLAGMSLILIKLRKRRE